MSAALSCDAGWRPWPTPGRTTDPRATSGDEQHRRPVGPVALAGDGRISAVPCCGASSVRTEPYVGPPPSAARPPTGTDDRADQFSGWRGISGAGQPTSSGSARSRSKASSAAPIRAASSPSSGVRSRTCSRQAGSAIGVEPAADLGRRGQVEVAQRAAEDDHLRVEDVDQVADAEAEPVADLAHRGLGPGCRRASAASTTASTASRPRGVGRPAARSSACSPISVSQQPREPQLAARRPSRVDDHVADLAAVPAVPGRAGGRRR